MAAHVNLKNKNNMDITFNNSNGMEDILKVYFHKQVPNVSVNDKATLVDILSCILYNTKNFRYGPIPAPEAQSKVRQVIRDYIADQRPIPILVPWGSIKADFSPSLDIAELSAISTLVGLNDQIKRYYEPGLDIAVRIEDLSGFRLFSMEPMLPQIMANSKVYSQDLVKLINIMGDNFITPRLESLMYGADKFTELEPRLTEIVYQYLLATDGLTNEEIRAYIVAGGEEFKKLQGEIWRGHISVEQREHYLSQYKKIYHDYDRGKLLYRLALYFGGSLARHRTKLVGDMDYWKGHFIQLALIPPIKGLPEGYNHNYVYYRTIPEGECRTHLAPWRAKGYLKIEGRNATQKVTTFWDKPEGLVPCSATIFDNEQSVRVRMDYIEM